MKKNFSVILQQTSHPGNIGATARAMKTMDIHDLRLINTTDPEQKEAYAMASGADDILYKAKKYDSLANGIADLDLILGLSARKRSQYRHYIYSNELVDLLNKKKDKTKIGLLFGNEQSGLDNEALSYCHYQIIVPTNNTFSSLNIASCVQLICYLCHTYQLQFQNQENNSSITPITQNKYEALTNMLITIIKASSMYNPQTIAQTTQRLRQIIQHSDLNNDDIDLIMGTLKQIKKIQSS